MVKNDEYVPEFNFHSLNGEIKYSPTIGIELETEDSNYCIDRLTSVINENEDYFYCKRDCSLREYGVEVVSHPATFEWINKNWNKWKSICDLQYAGLVSFSSHNCGCHIHISKQFFTCFDIFKLHEFFKNESDFIFKISERYTIRNMKNWARIETDKKHFIEFSKYKKNFEKCSAINLQHNETIEFRIFKGTLDEDSLKKNIQFVHSMWRFSKETSLQDMKKDKFVDFISNKKDYKELNEFVKKTS